MKCHATIYRLAGWATIKSVKTVTGDLVNRFPTGNQFQNVSPVIEFITRRVDMTQAMPKAEFDRYLGALV